MQLPFCTLFQLFPNTPTHHIQSPRKFQTAAPNMQLPTMHYPAANCFPIPPHIPSKHPVTFSHKHSPCSPPLCNLLQPTVSQSHTHDPTNHPVTFSQQHSPCSSSLCTLLQPIVSQSRTHPIQSPSNIQSAAINMQLPTMHSPAANCFPIPPTQPNQSPTNIQSAAFTM
jgi:hypothetical protein